MKNVRKFLGIIVMTCVVALPMVSCGDDDDTPSVDKTALNQLITECETLANSATSALYPQKAIDNFNTVISTAKTAAASESITQTQVGNLIEQLTTAKTVFIATAYETIPVSAMLIGLNFNEGTGTQLTTSGQRSLTATLMAGPPEIFGAATSLPTFVDGIKGTKGMRFDNGAHLEIANYAANDFLKNTMSVSVWVKPETTRGGNYIISLNYWNNWKLQVQEQNKPFFTIAATAGITDADNQADNSAPNNQWTHLVVTCDIPNSKMVFYVNGEVTMTWDVTGKANLKGTIAPAYTSPTGSQLPIMIGTATTYAEANAAWTWEWPRTPAGWDYFIGSMDNIRVYTIALTEGQVTGLYNAEKP